MADEGYSPKDRDDYIDALHQAQLKTETHRWEQAVKLNDDKAEKDAKAPPTEDPPKDDKPKRKGFL